MTRKDYVKIAEVLRKSSEDAHSVSGWVGVCVSFADMLRQDNDRFDEIKFYEACGFQEAIGHYDWRADFREDKCA
jgi:hypothetical protein